MHFSRWTEKFLFAAGSFPLLSTTGFSHRSPTQNLVSLFGECCTAGEKEGKGGRGRDEEVVVTTRFLCPAVPLLLPIRVHHSHSQCLLPPLHTQCVTGGRFLAPFTGRTVISVVTKWMDGQPADRSADECHASLPPDLFSNVHSLFVCVCALLSPSRRKEDDSFSPGPWFR